MSTVERLVALVPDDAARVLDLSCGTGELGASLKERAAEGGRTCRVTGVDPDPAALREAGRRLDETYRGDPLRVALPFPPKSFDAIVVPGTFEKVEDPARLAGLVFAWLKPGGTTVASGADRSTLESLLSGAGLRLVPATEGARGAGAGAVVAARRRGEPPPFRRVVDATIVTVATADGEGTAALLSGLAARSQGGSFEVVVVDNAAGGPIATMESGEDGFITVVHLDEPLSLAGALTEGARRSRGKVLVFLSEGFEVGEGFVGAVARLFEEDRTAGGAVPLVVSPDGSPEPSASGCHAVDSLQLGACCVRHSAFVQVWGFDGSLGPADAAADLVSKLAGEDWRVVSDPRVRLARRA